MSEHAHKKNLVFIFKSMLRNMTFTLSFFQLTYGPPVFNICHLLVRYYLPEYRGCHVVLGER